MSWTDEDCYETDEGIVTETTIFYGKPDYDKARKVIDNPASYKLLRDRIDPTLCKMGKPVVWWFDGDWEWQEKRLRAYLDTYDVVQETNIDAIMDFMPSDFVDPVHVEAFGTPGTDFYMPAETIDVRQNNRDEIMEIWAHEKGFLGFMQDKIDMYLHESYDLAEAKAFNKLCRNEENERQNNAIIAEHILTEALEPVSDSDYQAALDRINKGLDNGTYIEADYREQKGLPTGKQAEPEVDDYQEVYTTCGATRPKSHSGQESFDNFCAESSDAVPFPGYVEDNDNSAMAVGFAIIGGGVLLFGWLLAAIF